MMISQGLYQELEDIEDATEIVDVEDPIRACQQGLIDRRNVEERRYCETQWSSLTPLNFERP